MIKFMENNQLTIQEEAILLILQLAEKRNILLDTEQLKDLYEYYGGDSITDTQLDEIKKILMHEERKELQKDLFNI